LRIVAAGIATCQFHAQHNPVTGLITKTRSNR
jgi:hypothetical protein